MKAGARRGLGLALPGTLLLLVLLALALAAAQRGAALQWRAARWEGTRLQAREDAWGALRAAQAWVEAQGPKLRVRDCSAPRAAAEARVCAQAAGAPGDASWTRLDPALQRCAQGCAFHVQALDPAGEPASLRLSAWAGGPAQAMLQLDLQQAPEGGTGPRYRVRAWRVLR
ncbi:hypothetical protein [Thiomonas sp. FB-6]|uniref:hypothetical protein n=1 Tax=Thiomonas sp. FB-6 TaxID=1158291 RepID=UPI0003693BB8|nr:hypothetical protein [Thiomonas sp. FB-6]